MFTAFSILQSIFCQQNFIMHSIFHILSYFYKNILLYKKYMIYILNNILVLNIYILFKIFLTILNFSQLSQVQNKFLPSFINILSQISIGSKFSLLLKNAKINRQKLDDQVNRFESFSNFLNLIQFSQIFLNTFKNQNFNR